MIRIALFALRELHVPCLLPVFQVLSKQPNVEVGFLTSKVSNNPSQVPFEGLRENFIQSLTQSGKPFWGTNPEGNAFDCVVTADFCAEWIEGWGPSVCVGHGTISKNIYFTPNPTARRESYHDALCVPGPWFANSFGHFVKTRIVPTGFPKMDEYAVGPEKVAALRRELGFRPDRIHVLLAPTFNPEFSALPVAEEALKRIDTSRFHLQIKLHGATDPTTTQRIRQLCASKDGLTLSDSASVAPLLLAADIIITDVSSILLEAIANNKKVIAINNPQRFGFSLYQPDCVEFRFRDAAYEVWDPTGLLETLQLLCSADPKQTLRGQTALRLFGTQDGHNAERAAKVILEVANGIETRPCPFQSIIIQPDASSPHAIANLLWNLASRRWKQVPVVATDHATAATLKHLDRAAGLGLTILESPHHLPGEYTLLLTGEHYFPKDWDYAFAVSTDFLEQNLPRVLAPCLLGSVNPFQRPEFLCPDLKATVESAQSARPAAIEFQRRTKYRLFHESHTIPVALPDGCLFPANQLSPELLIHLKTRRELPPSLFHPMSGLAAPRALPSIIGIPGAWNASSDSSGRLTDPARTPKSPQPLHPPQRNHSAPPSSRLSPSESHRVNKSTPRTTWVPRNNPRVHVFLYTWNQAPLLEQTLKSLKNTRYSNWKVFVLDNGSSDGTSAILDAYESQKNSFEFEPVRLPVNIGAPAARNWLAGMPANQSADFLCYLDDDVELMPDWLSVGVKTFDAFPDAGVVGGKILFPSSPPVIQSTGAVITSEENWHNSINHQNLQEDKGQHDYIAERHYIMGCCQIYRKEVFDVCGAYDLRFSPTQFDDVEHQLRLRLFGYKVIYNAAIRVIHHATTGMSPSPASRVSREANRAKLVPLFSPKEIEFLVREQLVSQPPVPLFT